VTVAFDRVLITGGSGYLGTALASRLRGEAEVRILSRRPPVSELEARYFAADMTSLESLKSAVEGVSVVFHLAGQTSLQRAKDDPTADLAANVGSMLNLLQAVKETGQVTTIVTAGTITEAGLPAATQIDEAIADVPVTIYDVHKLTAERHLERASREGEAHGVTLRLANVYGPSKRSGSPDRGVINRMVQNALAGEPLTIFGDGEYLRDYVYIDDVVDAFLCAARDARALSGQHFLIGTGVKQTLASVVRVIAEQVSQRSGVAVSVVHVPAPETMDAIDARSYVVDSRRFSRLTGWSPKVDLAGGIDRTINALCSPGQPQ
jgi:nucleoside-diphosphate-sugar epimerase